jgi:hypothetical protein
MLGVLENPSLPTDASTPQRFIKSNNRRSIDANRKRSISYTPDPVSQTIAPDDRRGGC